MAAGAQLERPAYPRYILTHLEENLAAGHVELDAQALAQLEIGADSVVAAGAVVTRDVPPGNSRRGYPGDGCATAVVC
jgi:hypothetical protein